MTRRAQGPKIVGVGEQHIRTRIAHAAALVHYPNGNESVVEVRSDIFRYYTDWAEFAFGGLPQHLDTGDHLRVAYDRASGASIIEGVGTDENGNARIMNANLVRYVVGCAIGITSLSEDDHFVDRSTADYRRGLNFPVN